MILSASLGDELVLPAQIGGAARAKNGMQLAFQQA